MKLNWGAWFYSLIAGGIGGAANALGGIIVAPTVFNFTPQGWGKIGELALFGFLVPVLTFLKQSPLPPPVQTTTETTTLQKTTVVSPAPDASAKEPSIEPHP